MSTQEERRRNSTAIEEDIRKRTQEKEKALRDLLMCEGIKGKSDPFYLHLKKSFDNKIAILEEELLLGSDGSKRRRTEDHDNSGQPALLEIQNQPVDASSDDDLSVEDYAGGGGFDGETWVPSEDMKDSTNFWLESPLIKVLQSLQVDHNHQSHHGMAMLPNDSFEFCGRIFHKGRCYKYHLGENKEVIVGINGFCAKSGMVNCVLVVPFSWTFLGYKNPKVDYEAKCKHSEYWSISVPLKPLSLESFGKEFSEQQSIPEWVHEPPMKGSAYNFAYKKTGKRRLRGLRKTIRLTELFAGCGGMSCGFKESGFECVLAVEKNPKAAMAHGKNHPRGNIQCMCVKDLLGSASHLIRRGCCEHNHGSPSCQGYSKCNTTGDENKKKENNDLSLTWVGCVLKMKSITASYENVVGLFDYEHQPYLRQMVDELMGGGYQVRVCLLYAHHYGDPQKRPRIFLFAAREFAYLPDVPPKTHDEDDQGFLPVVTVKDAFQGLAKAEGKSCNNKEFPPGTPRLQPDGLAKTLLASKEPPLHYEHDRLLTIPEAASLFSYPAGYIFVGQRKDQLRQIGNSVPVRLAYAVAESFKRVLLYRYEDEEDQN